MKHNIEIKASHRRQPTMIPCLDWKVDQAVAIKIRREPKIMLSTKRFQSFRRLEFVSGEDFSIHEPQPFL